MFMFMFDHAVSQPRDVAMGGENTMTKAQINMPVNRNEANVQLVSLSEMQ